MSFDEMWSKVEGREEKESQKPSRDLVQETEAIFGPI